MSEEVQPRPTKSGRWVRRVIIYIVVLLVVFLLGLIPALWLNSQCSRSLADVERQLDLAVMQNALASAAITAQRGDYEPARQSASDFFTSVRAEIDRGDASALSLAQREGLQPLLAQRDEIITLLARSDPAAADRLSDLFGSYREIMMDPDPRAGGAED